MAKRVYKGLAVYVGGYSLAADLSEARLVVSVGEIQTPVLGKDGIPRLSGLRNFEFTQTGYFEAGDGKLDAVMFPEVGGAELAATICPTGGAGGEVAYFVKGARGGYETGASIGSALTLNGGLYAVGQPAVRGTVMQNGAVTATGNSTARQLGAVGATQRLYAALHCIASVGSGDRALTVKVQSCPTSGFASSVTDRITFSNITTAVGAQFAAPVDGAITDEHWRLSWTATGTGLSFNIIGSIGIL